jgi:transposase
MRAPLFNRPLTDAERQTVQAGLRSTDAFVLRRCQMLAANDRHERAPQIARDLGCGEQTVRNVIQAFNQAGLGCLSRGSSRPHTVQAAFPGEQAERLKALLHQSPRCFGRPTSIWTLDLAAQGSFAEGLTAAQVSGETIRATLARLGVRWQRAKDWITSPDPAYARKKGTATA